MGPLLLQRKTDWREARGEVGRPDWRLLQYLSSEKLTYQKYADRNSGSQSPEMALVNTPSVSQALVQFLSVELTLACGQQEAVEVLCYTI